MSVGENVAYGLKARKVARNERNERVMKALELVQIADLKDRQPDALSGGQQQRVALARAFVIEPGILLMDEPLSNLDAKLRVQMRSVIKKLQSKLGITTIYVTHDQEEALAISDRIAVMNAGKIMQVGRPEEIYSKPNNLFVANFIGNTNRIAGKITEVDGDCLGTLVLDAGSRVKVPLNQSYTGDVIVAIRPEHFFFGDQGITAKIQTATFLGDFVLYEVQLPTGQVVLVNEYRMRELREIGASVKLYFDEYSISVYKNEEEVISC